MKLNLNFTIDLDEAQLLDYIEEYDSQERSLADIDALEDFIGDRLTRYFCAEHNLPDDEDEHYYRDLLGDGLTREQCRALRATIKDGVFKYINNCFGFVG